MDAPLIQQLQRGDPEASYQFVREYYPGVYRYLLYLTGHREKAEDLTQETFLQAWRRLETFQGRAPLHIWLHRIARREFLQSVRSQRPETSLEEVAEAAAPRGADWAEAMELRDVLQKLPDEEREVVALHYLEGYTCEEIAQIARVHVSRVKYRLSLARAHLQRELGEGDIVYLNEPAAPMRQWAWLPLDQMYALQTRLATQAIEDRAAPGHGAQKEEPMERREFLRQAAAGAVGLMVSDTDKDTIDDRLMQKVTLAFKGTALSDVCEHVWRETGVHLAAGNSVADEKVTLFCKQTPLREVMRQLSRPFGYTWLRTRQLAAP